jgi:hypothetical protein
MCWCVAGVAGEFFLVQHTVGLSEGKLKEDSKETWENSRNLACFIDSIELKSIKLRDFQSNIPRSPCQRLKLQLLLPLPQLATSKACFWIPLFYAFNFGGLQRPPFNRVFLTS